MWQDEDRAGVAAGLGLLTCWLVACVMSACLHALCCVQMRWGFYVEAGRVAQCFEPARGEALTPEARTESAFNISADIIAACTILLAVQKCLCPSLTPPSVAAVPVL